jgi:hypothetical protein
MQRANLPITQQDKEDKSDNNSEASSQDSIPINNVDEKVRKLSISGMINDKVILV